MNNYNGYGKQPRKMRLTKSYVVDMLKAQLNIPYAETMFYDDNKSVTRHCCLGEPGIKYLNVSQWQFTDEDGKLINVNYFVCPRCSKLLVYRDFM